MLLGGTKLNLTITDSLPGYPSLSSEATVTVENKDIAEVALQNPQEWSVHISAHKYGTITVTVTDGDKELRYTLEIYDDDGVDRAKFSPIKPD